MKMDFNIQTKLDKSELLEKSKQVLWLSMNKMQGLAKRYAPFDTGKLSTSIHLLPMSSGANQYILTDGVDYGIHMEYGTRPHWMPAGALKGWSRRKLGNEGAAYGVQAKIASKGVEAHPFFRPALDQVKDYWAAYYWKQVMGT